MKKKITTLFYKIIRFFLPQISLKRLLLTIAHALWMIVFTLLWLAHINMYDGFDFMNDLMDYRELLNKHILHKEPAPFPSDKYLLLNTSRNNEILPSDNDNTTNTVITDRAALLSTLQILDSNASGTGLIVCDVFFEKPSSDTYTDSLLKQCILSLSNKNKLIIPRVYNEEAGSFTMPVFSCKSGLSQYRSSFLNTQFLKYTYMPYDTMKQIPLLAYEAISGQKMEKKSLLLFPYYTLSGRWCLNTIIPEIRYTSDMLEEDLNYHHIGCFSKEMLKEGQIVVIGDFEGTYDAHHSMADLVPGALILINTLEALMQGDNIISLQYLILLFVFFFFVGYYTFFKKDLMMYHSNFVKKNLFFRFITAQANYLLLLLLALISMLYFHHYIHFLILMSYFLVIDLLIHLFQRIKRKKRKKPIS